MNLSESEGWELVSRLDVDIRLDRTSGSWGMHYMPHRHRTGSLGCHNRQFREHNNSHGFSYCNRRRQLGDSHGHFSGQIGSRTSTLRRRTQRPQTCQGSTRTTAATTHHRPECPQSPRTSHPAGRWPPRRLGSPHASRRETPPGRTDLGTALGQGDEDPHRCPRIPAS